MTTSHRCLAACGVLALLTATTRAQQQLPPIEVGAPRVVNVQVQESVPVPPPPVVLDRPVPLAELPGRTVPPSNNIGSPLSASQGFFSQADIARRPLLRTTEVFELIPGLIVTQHSSQGKANQYFLRGFSLDHGTDFAGFVDDVPYNLPTNGHGQGYLDLNSVIPELISTVEFRKGPYYANVGDFSAAGSMNVRLFDELPYGFAKVEVGMYDWYRAVVADSVDVGPGHLLYAVQANGYNGPFAIHENFGRLTGVLRYTMGDAESGARLSLIGYHAQGRSIDQIPLRAVHQGLIPSTGVIDPSDFLLTSRYTANAQFWHDWGNGSVTKGNIYGAYYSLSLFSNFTFFLADPVNGDQIGQFDRRWITGTNLSHSWRSRLFGEQVVNTVGFQLRNDSIPLVGLYNTRQRATVSRVTDDSVHEISVSPWFSNEIKWADKVRTVVGARGDYFHFDVDSRVTPENSGTESARLFSPKGSIIFGPWNHTEFYINGGFSFHSNDARGVVATIDPLTGDPATKAPGLVRAKGAEFGMRSQAIRNLTTGFAVWQLNLAEELVFVGDAGTTEPFPGSDRYGIEFTNSYKLCDWVTLDADYSWSHGRLIGDKVEPGANRIPQAITTTFSGGPSIQLPSGWFSTLRFRYVGSRSLVEDNSFASNPTHLWELAAGYQNQRFTAGVQVLNLFDSKGHDIDYYYGSGLKTDPGFPFPPGDEGVQDYHFKRLEPFAVRFYLTLRW